MRADVPVLLARLCEYPGEDIGKAASSLVEALTGAQETAPELETLARGFSDFVSQRDVHELEELYIRTFDIHAPVCLDVGWQLFGDSYKRGAFLVKMKDAVRRHGLLDATPELPDHLSVILRLLPRLSETEDPRGLVVEAVLPALEKMRAAFQVSKDQGPGPVGYATLLRLVETWLRRELAVTGRVQAPETESFHLPVLQDTQAFFQGINERD